MNNRQQVAILRQGRKAWNEWRRENPEIAIDLRWSHLYKENLVGMDLSGANFASANMRGVDFSYAILDRANFRGAYLHEAHLNSSTLFEADLSRANLGFADLTGCLLKRVDLTGASLEKANLWGANLKDAHLIGTDLTGVDFSNTVLTGANFSGSKLSNTNFSLKKLRGLNFYRAKLIEANLGRADLSGANLRGADLSEANLSRIKLKEANLRDANLSKANLYRADLRKANFSNAQLVSAMLVEANLSDANINKCTVYGTSAWNLNLLGATQSDLIVTRDHEPMIKVDNIEVAQLIYLLLNRKKMQGILNAVIEKGVLILGRFGDGGLEVLQSIAERLREESYIPILFDFAKPNSRNYTETIKILAGLSRFIIADLSGPSVPQELHATVPHFSIPFVPIIDKNKKTFSMFIDYRANYPWVLEPVVFSNKEQLIETLPEKVIAPAEKRVRRQQKIRDSFLIPG